MSTAITTTTQQPTALATVQAEPDIASVLAGHCMPNTIAMYMRDLEAYREYAGAAWLNPDSLLAYRDSMVTDTTKSPNTINRQLASVKSIVKRMARRKLVAAELAMEFEQVENVSIPALRDRLKAHSKTQIAPADMRSICEAPNTGSLAGKMHSALLHTLASSALRIHEALKLKLSDIHYGQRQDGSRGYYLMTLGKGKSAEMEAQLSGEAYAAIQEWVSARQRAGITTDLVFTSFGGRGDSRITEKQLTAPSAWLIVKRYSKAVGVDFVKPHDFRRFVATQINARHGINTAKDVLRHANIATTQAYITSEIALGMTENLY